MRLVWARLERPAARHLVEAAARSELVTVSGFVGRVDAPQVLADRLCDDRMLLGSGRDCLRCEDQQASSRAQRHAVAAAVDAVVPYASEAERCTAAERQLHETVTARAWAREREWEQVRAAGGGRQAPRRNRGHAPRPR